MQVSGEHKEDRMRKETEIDLAVAEAVGSKYDNACKRLFQNREIGFLTLVNRIIWQKPHNCGFFYVKFIKF